MSTSRRDRRNDGNDHDRQDHARGQHADAVGRPAEKPRPAERLAKKWLHIFAKYRHQNEDCPKSVDHARDRGQKFGGEGKNSAQPDRAHFGDEHGHADRQRHGDDQRKQRRHDRAVNERQRAILILDRIPVGLAKELPAKSMPRKLRADDQLVNDQAQQRDHRHAAKAHRPAKRSIGDLADLPLQQRRRSGFDFQGGLCSPLRFGSVETRPGQGLIRHSVPRLAEGCYKSVKKRTSAERQSRRSLVCESGPRPRGTLVTSWTSRSSSSLRDVLQDVRILIVTSRHLCPLLPPSTSDRTPFV